MPELSSTPSETEAAGPSSSQGSKRKLSSFPASGSTSTSTEDYTKLAGLDVDLCDILDDDEEESVALATPLPPPKSTDDPDAERLQQQFAEVNLNLKLNIMFWNIKIFCYCHIRNVYIIMLR